MKLKSSEMTEKDTISHKKPLVKSTINNIREKLNILDSKILKNKSKTMRKTLYLKERVINDDDLDDSDIEGISGLLNNLEEYLLKKVDTMTMMLNIRGLEILDICLMKMKIKTIINQN